jgi:hypothetical protein
MAHYAGKSLYVDFGATDVSGDFRSMDVSESINIIDTTAGADTDESHVTGVRSATIDLTILCNGTAGSAVRSALAVGTNAALRWGPNGTASGNPKYECTATVESMDYSYPYDGEVEFTVSLVKDGTWTSHYEHDGSTW